jgi:hypothetical protein
VKAADDESLDLSGLTLGQLVIAYLQKTEVGDTARWELRRRLAEDPAGIMAHLNALENASEEASLS